MARFYSQQGEDFILDQVFQHKSKGFFVEIGCIDGKRFSNTLFFEEKGWQGLCVEAHADYIDLLKINRPNSIICHCAVAESDDEEVIFYANKRGSLSTLDRTIEARWQKDYAEYFTGFEEQSVKKRTLNTIFAENCIDHIDILSIDIEGYEVAALQGLNLQKYHPTAIVIESDSEKQEEQIDHILLPNGYRKTLRIRSNIFYFADELEIEKGVKDKVFEVEIIHTGNPFFQENDSTKVISIDTRKYPCVTKVVKIFEISEDTSSDKYVPSKESSLINESKNMNNSQPLSETQIQGIESSEKPSRELSEQFEVGFHGDIYLLALVNYISQFIHAFIETGANVGTTAGYFGRTFPEIKVYSCEPDPTAFQTATNYTKELKNVRILNQPSPNFLYKLHRKHPDLYQKTNLYWLDAHGYGFEWSLNDEVKFLTGALKSGFILIDDFRIPDRPEFKFCQYDGQVCEFEMIAPHLSDRHTYTFVYPKYSDRTSKHHPLVGVALIVFGVKNFSLPPDLAEKFTVTQTIPTKTSESKPQQAKANSAEHGVMVKRNRFADVKKILQKDNPIIVDGGANHGNMTQKFLEQYAEPTIYAFEPIPHLAEELKERHAAKESVHVFQQALGAENTVVSFNILNYQNSSSILTPGKWKQKYHGEKVDISKTVEVQQVRLDQAIPVEEVDILKLDLQGYELEAVKGAGDLLDRITIIITEVEFVPLYEKQPLFGDIDLFLRNAGFRLLNLYELYTHPDGQLTSGDAVYLNTRYFGA